MVIPNHFKVNGPTDVPAGPRLTSQERAVQDRRGAGTFDQMRSQLIRSGAATLWRSLPPPSRPPPAPDSNLPPPNFPPPPPLPPPTPKPRKIQPNQQVPYQQVPQQSQSNAQNNAPGQVRRVQFGGNDGSYMPNVSQHFAPATASTPKTAPSPGDSSASQHSDTTSQHGS